MAEEYVVLVDRQNNQIGTEEKLRAHEQGLLHRAFSVFIFNDQGQLLLQQRQKDKYHCGGLWTNTCCSHPRVDEDIVAAGKRRMIEEMGFVTELELVGDFVYRAEFDNGLVEHEFDNVLIGQYNNENIEINPEEVESYAWVSLEDVAQDLIANPDRYTPWFGLALQVVRTHWERAA